MRHQFTTVERRIRRRRLSDRRRHTVRAIVPFRVLVVACDHLLGIKTDKRQRTAVFTQQIIGSLKLYHTRGEFDGTIPGAIRCLAQAGYFEGLFHD